MSGRRSALLPLLLAVCGGPLLAQTDVTITDATVCEGGPGEVTQAAFDVTVTFLGTSEPPVTILYETADGSATATDGDYVPVPPGMGLFFDSSGPMTQTQTITIDVLGDSGPEADEQFTVELSVDDQAVNFVKQKGVGTITDDDTSTISVGPPAPTAEGDAGTVDAIFTVSLTPPVCSPVTLGVQTADLDATAGTDYVALPAGTQVSFKQFQAIAAVPVSILGDTTLESDESFELVVTAPGSGALSPPEVRATATILNDDTVRLSIGDTAVFEDDAGTTLAGVPVQLSAPSDLPVSVGFATRDGTATGGGDDYGTVSGQIDFAPGETLKKVEVPVLGDTAIEPDEVLFVDLSSPSPATALLGDAEGTVTIRNDDAEGPGELRLLAPPEVSEGDGSVTVTVERRGGAGGPATVRLTTADDSAVAGRDYRSRSRILRWADGDDDPKTFSIPILDDETEEPDERFLVALSEATGAVLGAPSAGAVVIRDDDQPSSLEPVGDTSRDSRVNQRLLFQVLASRADGTPVAGATVVWSVEGDAELIGEPETTTGDDGIAGIEVLLGGRPGRVTVTAEIPESGQTVRFEILVESGLDGLFDPGTDPEESALASLLDNACVSPTPGFEELCDYLLGLDPADQRALIEELLPREAGALADLLLLSPQAQLVNLRRHLAARRGGGGSGNQITLNFDGRSLPLGTLKVTIAGRRATEERLAAAIAAAMFQQGDAEESGAAPAPAEIDAESRLGFFASGQVEVGDRPGSAREAGFDLDTTGLTVGLDYRVRPRLILGAALGLVRTDTRLERDGGGTDVEGESLSLFLTWFRDRAWFDAIVDYGRYDYETSRSLDLPAPFAGQRRLVARASPEGSQLAAELGAGYDASFGATGLALFGRLSYIDGELDAYSERGGGPFNLTVAAQPVESLLLEAGVELVYAASQSWGVLQPILRASALREFEDDSRLLTASFVTDPGAGLFRVATDPPDRDYFRLGAGLTATFPRGRAVYLMYDTDLARDDLDLYRLSGGLRLAF